MNYWEKINTVSKEGFDLELSVTWEDLPLNQIFDDEEANEIAIQLERGDLVYFVAKVEGYKKGIRLSAPSIGGNVYQSYSDFVGSYEHEALIEEALEEAKARLKELTE